mgnify:CR=1 FL=1
MPKNFELVTDYKPEGDQPEAIAELTKGFEDGEPFQTLLGVTGSGKTFTMASVIANLRLITQLFDIQTIPTRVKPGCAEHLAILDALIAGDPKMARKAMRIHLDRVRAGVMDYL